MMEDQYNNKKNYILKQSINMGYMLSLYTFAYSNGEISSCLMKKHREIFKDEWFIAWFKDFKEIARQKLLNTPDLKRQIRKFLLDMSDMILLFGFAGFYYVKDMEKWIEYNSEQYLSELPFGIIPIRVAISGGTGGTSNDSYQPTLYGGYMHYTNTHTMQEIITFECNDKILSRNYEFEVFNHSAKFVSLSDGISTISNPCNYAGSFNNNTGPSSAELIPISLFVSLYRQKSLIEEALDNRFDADFVASHPQTFITAKPVPDAKLDSLSENTYYSSDTLLGAKQQDSVKKQMFAMQNVKWLVEEMNAKSGTKHASMRPEDLLRNQRKLKYKRPDMTEGIHTIPEYVEVKNTHNPSTINDYETLQNNYERNVCDTVRLPYLFYKSDGGNATSSSKNNGRSVNEEQINFHRSILTEEIDNEHTMLSTIFSHLYGLTYFKLDRMSIETYYDSIMTEEEKKERKKDPNRKKETKEEKEKRKKNSKKNIKERVNIELSSVKVQLSFEKLTHRSSAAIEPLLKCVEKGVISPTYLKKYIYLVYGKEDELI